MKNHKEVLWLGGTRDDATGEAFDKTGRILGLSYPAGPEIEKLAENITDDIFNFPSPLINSSDFDFSFSGLKTAVLREVESNKKLGSFRVSQISYSLQKAIFKVLIKKTFNAIKKYNAKSLVLGGGVTANQALKRHFQNHIAEKKLNANFFVPPKNLCTDNAAMIAAAGYFNKTVKSWNEISANPELYFD
jgi:tRNA N6-adenosine threonylcarbamoyltransferase